MTFTVLTTEPHEFCGRRVSQVVRISAEAVLRIPVLPFSDGAGGAHYTGALPEDCPAPRPGVDFES
jgi:hypothetical protein